MPMARSCSHMLATSSQYQATECQCRPNLAWNRPIGRVAASGSALGDGLNNGVADDQERPQALHAGRVVAVHDAAHGREDTVVPGIERSQILRDVGHVEELADGHVPVVMAWSPSG